MRPGFRNIHSVWDRTPGQYNYKEDLQPENIRQMIPDIYSLKKLVKRRQIELIHSHQDNDSLTAVLAGLGNRLIRTCYEGEPATLNFRQRFFWRRTGKILTASKAVQTYLSKIFLHAFS